MSQAQRIADNLHSVRDRVATAAARSGRDANEIRVVAVTKYVDAEASRQLYESGCRELGESRPQELWNKCEQLADLQISWHLIGHLQRNKAKRSVPLVSWIHSVDSLRLLREIDGLLSETEHSCRLLLEVNISGDPNKHGFAPDAMTEVLEAAAELRSGTIHGLMGMASREGGSEQARREFARLRLLRAKLQENCPDSISLDELSMGMSGDFEEGILEGATIVRIGSALFDGVK